MASANAEHIRLEFSGGRRPLTALAAINEALARVGTRVWPLDLGRLPDGVRRLVRQPRLTELQVARVKAHFLMSRERLLEVIAAAGRTPHVPGGGALTTRVSPHGYAYPQLWIVTEDADYSRFDRFHVNAADDGTGVDEVLQILCGAGVVIHQRRSSGEVLTLRLTCPGESAGWLVTYDGGARHIGSLSGATPGTKVLVQAIGPPEWTIRYEDHA